MCDLLSIFEFLSWLVQGDMRNKMTTIDGNLEQVRRNLEYLEEMYDTIFRKVNRLFVDPALAQSTWMAWKKKLFGLF